MAEKNKKILTAIVILLIVLPFVLADLSSTNYNMFCSVFSSGCSKSTSTNFISRLALGILSGISTSGGFENFLGIFYGSDTTPTTVEIKYPVSSTLYYSYLGTLNYTVDPPAVSCWYSKNGGLTNSTPVAAGMN